MVKEISFEKRPNDPKILIFDIETAPALGWFWQMWETNIIDVKEQGYMLSFSCKWLGEKKIHTFGLPDYIGYNKNPSNDRYLIKELSRFISEADIVVAHNGDRFDITTTNTRLIANGLPPMPPFKSIDTLKVARNKFKFLSNKLDDLGNFLGVGRKIPHTGKHLWFACMNRDMDAWRTMKKYNEQDVLLLEAVYIKLLPWMTNHPNRNLYRRVNCCPKCGSNKIQSRGYRFLVNSKRMRYQCQNCGGWCSGEVEKLDKIIIN